MRTGEMPLGIAPYGSTYTKIAATAPELKGLWSIAMIPGVQQEDGTINRATSSTATGCVMHHTAVNRGVDMEAFRFMTWWTGEEAQTSYAQSVEAAMGVAGRVAVANKGAFEQLGWTTAERQVLQGQAEWVQGIPQVPGNYILNRSLTNALRRSVDEMEENRRMLTIYNQFINEELERKRQEFER